MASLDNLTPRTLAGVPGSQLDPQPRSRGRELVDDIERRRDERRDEQRRDHRAAQRELAQLYSTGALS